MHGNRDIYLHGVTPADGRSLGRSETAPYLLEVAEARSGYVDPLTAEHRAVIGTDDQRPVASFTCRRSKHSDCNTRALQMMGALTLSTAGY